MTRLRIDLSISADGFVAGPEQSLEHPLGVGGDALHEWAFATRTFQAVHGEGGGATGLDDDVAAAARQNVGALIMGRRMFGGGPGPWDRDEPWLGWWGERPPYGHPVFVLTHHEREPLPMEGGTTFHFVTDGIESALVRATEAADGGDVVIGGGADVARQYLRAGLVDALALHMVPVLLGSGERLLGELGDGLADLRPDPVVSSPAVAHLHFRRA